jgi:hypothetical protein
LPKYSSSKYTARFSKMSFVIARYLTR